VAAVGHCWKCHLARLIASPAAFDHALDPAAPPPAAPSARKAPGNRRGLSLVRGRKIA
jgi:hypothetical protein